MAYFHFVWTDESIQHIAEHILFRHTSGSHMTDLDTKRTQRDATPQEREKLQQYRAQIEQELPELTRRAKESETARRAAARREPTISGQLRRAVAESGRDHRELAQQVGISGKALAEFLIGTTPLDSSVIDKLAALLKQQLKPIG